MKKFLFVFLVLTAVVGVGIKLSAPVDTPIYIHTPPSAIEHYVGKVKFDNGLCVRLLILKHCPDRIGETDIDQISSAANLAQSKGLRIRDLGQFDIDRDGPMQFQKTFYTLDQLQTFVSEQMRVDAEAGDTFVIYTVGHGGGDGSLMRLGQRTGIVTCFANAAEENDQETFWWQLSCHAAAELPPISSLTPKQQDRFAMIASSSAKELSYFCSQGEQMEKVFSAMGQNSTEINPNQDHEIVAEELRNYMNKHIESGRGDLIFAKSPQEVIFGFDLANSIPIFESDGTEGNYPRNYIPHPRRP